MTIIPHNKPHFNQACARAAYEVVLSGRLAAGDNVSAVEAEWANRVKAEDAAMVSSGLSALRLALRALSIGPGDEVVVPGYSCALITAVLSLGATPVLADVLMDDWTIDPGDIKQKLTSKTKAIVAVHLFGQQARISELKEFGYPIIEDMAHGIFSQTADLCVSSFWPTKLLASTGGGIVSGGNELIEKTRQFRYYGNREPDGLILNDVSNELEAAILIEQFKILDDEISQRKVIAQFYDGAFADNESLVTPTAREVYYRYTVRLKTKKASDVCEIAQKHGIMFMQPVWQHSWGDGLVNTEIAFSQLVSLPMYSLLSGSNQKIVIKVFREALINV